MQSHGLAGAGDGVGGEEKKPARCCTVYSAVRVGGRRETRRKPARCCTVYSAVRVGGGGEGRNKKKTCEMLYRVLGGAGGGGGGRGEHLAVMLYRVLDGCMCVGGTTAWDALPCLRRSSRAGVEAVSREKLCRLFRRRGSGPCGWATRSPQGGLHRADRGAPTGLRGTTTRWTNVGGCVEATTGCVFDSRLDSHYRCSRTSSICRWIVGPGHSNRGNVRPPRAEL